MRPWEIRSDTQEIYPLDTLLRLRQDEERRARATFSEALSRQAAALEALAPAEALAETLDAALVAFQIEAAGRRAEGYTIADRLAQHDEERDLLHQARQAEAARDALVERLKQAGAALEDQRGRWEEARRQLDAAQQHHDRWRQRRARRADLRDEEEALERAAWGEPE
jgi:hypothetical protein